jgi:hypothetical protein
VTATGTYGTATATSTAVNVPSPQLGTPTLHRQTDTVTTKGATKVKVGCTGPGPCTGTLQLTATITTHHHHKTQHHHVVIAKTTFTIPADHTTPVTVHLNHTGRQLLAAAGGKLHLTITVNPSGKRQTASAKGTLKLVHKHKHKHKHNRRG